MAEAAARDWLARLTARPLLLLTFVALLAWLPGFASLPPLDRDESRFAQASKQMVESGNWVDIRFGQESRYKKPIGIYWLQATAATALGKAPYNAIWTYRVPSLLGALAAVLLTYWCALALGSCEAALAGAVLAALTLGIAAEAHIAKTDAVLLACIVAAQSVLLRLYLAARGQGRVPGRGVTAAGWGAVALGILIKGPVILAILALTAAGVSFWDRRWRWLRETRPLLGLAICLVLTAPWLIAIELASHGQFLNQALGHDFAGKLAGGQETHGAPPGYFLVLSTLTLWPATLGAIPGLALAWTRRSEPAMRFVLMWIGPSWLMFEAVPTKLPHYILPVYPALAILAGLWLTVGAARWGRVAASVQLALGSVLLAAALILLPAKYGMGATSGQVLLALLAAVAGLLAAALLLRGEKLSALASVSLAGLILYRALMWAVAPGLQSLWLSPRIAAIVEAARKPGDPPIFTAGYDEPSLIFLLGTATQIGDGTGAAHHRGLVLIEDNQRSAFLAGLGAVKAQALGSIDGINYSRGKHVHITLYRVSP